LITGAPAPARGALARLLLAVTALLFLLFSFFFGFFLPCSPAGRRVGLGLQQQEGRGSAAAQHQNARRDRDDQNRRLLLGRSFALGALFAFGGGSFLFGFFGHARGSLESMDPYSCVETWLTMCFGGHFAAG
jgi:hypothetical protein